MNFTFEGRRVEISASPAGLESKYDELFTMDAVDFLSSFVSHFQPRVAEHHPTQKLLRSRNLRKLTLDISGSLPTFKSDEAAKIIEESDWKISPLPLKLENRQVDLGDVSPSNAVHFKSAVMSEVQGVQVDFDDGDCPTWTNIIQGHHNIMAFTRGQFFPMEVPQVESAPILMLRPRAWNMIEHNVLVNGREVQGALLDFGLLMVHVGKVLADSNVGPFFYLSKVEAASEALLWNDIILWTQLKLGIPRGTIKACVLIENILSAFEMDHILYELREHSLGLNCGIWDYAASIVTKFGDRPSFVLPDRNNYVNIQNHFLLTYIRLVVKTCHRRGAPATGGMAALTTHSAAEDVEKERIAELVCKAKLREIEEGLDGFLIYDPYLLPAVKQLWSKYGTNQITSVLHKDLVVAPEDLLMIPGGDVTLGGIRRNIKVGILFIYSWLANGRGHFLLDGGVEDSATAEISRSQIWQYIFHQIKLADGSKEVITKAFVTTEAKKVLEASDSALYNKVILEQCVTIFLEIVTAAEFPAFITTFLYNHSTFRALQKT